MEQIVERYHDNKNIDSLNVCDLRHNGKFALPDLWHPFEARGKRSNTDNSNQYKARL
jgi:hypothetical protein